MVDADANGGVMLLANVDEGHKTLVDFAKLGLIFLVGILQMAERTCRVDVVTRVDAHLLAILCGHIGHAGVEVDVGHEWRHDAFGLQSGRDVAHIFRFARALGGQSDQFTASFDDALGLRHAGGSIVGVRRCHRLDADGVVASNDNGADVSRSGKSSSVGHGGMGLLNDTSDD